MVLTYVQGAEPSRSYDVHQDDSNHAPVRHLIGAGTASTHTSANWMLSAPQRIFEMTMAIEAEGGGEILRYAFVSGHLRTEDGVPPSVFGWTREEARSIRARLSAWAEDWDDPAMDVYNLLLEG